jgi:hypothetical protein
MQANGQMSRVPREVSVRGGSAQVVGPSPQRERPDRRVDQDHSAPPAAERPTIMVVPVLDLADHIEDTELLAALNVLRECRRHGLAFGRVSPDAPGFLDQSVIKCQIRCHPRTPNPPTHSHVWGTSGHGSPGSPCLTRGSGGAASAGAARDLQPTMLANTARVPEPAGAHRVRRDRSVPRPGRGQELPRRSRIARCFCCPRGATRAAGWPAVIRPSLHRAALGPEPSRWHLENAVRAGTWCTYRPRPRWAGAAPDRSRQAGGVGPGGCPPDALLPALMLRNDQDSRRPRVSTPWRGAGHSRCSRDRPARSSPARSSCCR